MHLLRQVHGEKLSGDDLAAAVLNRPFRITKPLTAGLMTRGKVFLFKQGGRVQMDIDLSDKKNEKKVGGVIHQAINKYSQFLADSFRWSVEGDRLVMVNAVKHEKLKPVFDDKSSYEVFDVDGKIHVKNKRFVMESI